MLLLTLGRSNITNPVQDTILHPTRILPPMLWTLLACTGTSTEPKTEAPDIVLVVIDTLRADHLSTYGYPLNTSPNIDAMAAEGLRFDRAYAHSGWTLASFSSMFTGLLPHEHRVGRDAKNPDRFGRLSDDVVTLAESLSEAGYATAAIMNNTFLAPEFNLQQGFGEDYNWSGATNKEHRSADESVKLALDWLNAQTKPAFVVVHFMEPHLDYDPPEDLRHTFTPKDSPLPYPITAGSIHNAIQGGELKFPDALPLITGPYDEEILAADRAVGVLRAGIAARGRPTITALTSDHGEEFLDHGGFEHGHTLYGELTRIPLILNGANIPTGAVRTVVSHSDMFQTFIAAAGAKKPENTGGEDLLALAAQGAWVPGRDVVCENVLYGPPLMSLVDGDYRMVINQLSGAGEIWAVAESGGETVRVQGPPQDQQAQRMTPILKERRGDLKPMPEVNDARMPDFETFKMLQELGYIE